MTREVRLTGGRWWPGAQRNRVLPAELPIVRAGASPPPCQCRKCRRKAVRDFLRGRITEDELRERGVNIHVRRRR